MVEAFVQADGSPSALAAVVRPVSPASTARLRLTLASPTTVTVADERGNTAIYLLGDLAAAVLGLWIATRDGSAPGHGVVCEAEYAEAREVRRGGDGARRCGKVDRRDGERLCRACGVGWPPDSWPGDETSEAAGLAGTLDGGSR